MKKIVLLSGLCLMHWVALAQFTLSPLPFNLKALEPTIDATTVEVHYYKHHQGYVTNLNSALSESLKSKSIEELLANAGQYGNAIRNNAGGHYNHTLYWAILNPAPGAAIHPKLKQEIESQFGSLNGLFEKMQQEGMARFGSGWVWLVRQKNGQLAVGSTTNQDNPLMDVSELKGYPLIAIDLWEHAYYLNYKNKRLDYIKAVCGALNWNVISTRYLEAR
ncbi:MAG: superoxide dismutase [Chitinophagaceae bacterium]|nr:superoxide dismutase [Chitinophagaceae bacterium]